MLNRMHASSTPESARRPDRWLHIGISVIATVLVLGLLVLPTPRRAAAFTLPTFTVAVDGDVVFGDNWSPNTYVYVAVDDPSTTKTPDFQRKAKSNSVGTFWVDFGDIIDLRPPFTVTASQKGGTSKEHQLTRISAVDVDVHGDRLWGTSNPSVKIASRISGADPSDNTSVTSTGLGTWMLDYSGIYDFEPGETTVLVTELDADGDGTMIGVLVPDNDSPYDGDGDLVRAMFDDVDRLWGTNRYGTSAAVSETAFEEADTVFIALGTNFPDALVAAAAGGYQDAPVLLTGTDSLAAETVAELVRLTPDTAYIVGGTAVISAAVEKTVGTYVPTVERLSGANRFATSAAVSAAIFDNPDAAFIALGTNFPDALVGAAAAGYLDAPVLLTGGTHAPQPTIDELKRLGPSTIYIVGGTAVISESVATELVQYGNIVRLSGPNRYATAAAVAEEVFRSADYAFLADGTNFPDALVAAAAGGSLGGPVLLVNHDSIPGPTREQLDRLTPNHVFVVGGQAVIGDTVFSSLP